MKILRRTYKNEEDVVPDEIVVFEDGLPKPFLDFTHLVTTTVTHTFTYPDGNPRDFRKAVIIRFVFDKSVGKDEYSYVFDRIVA